MPTQQDRAAAIMRASNIDLVDPTRPSALTGELGAMPNQHGGMSTEISHTVRDPRDPGKFINVPVLVEGQSNVDRILRMMEAMPEQQRIAIARALERVAAGESLPSFDTPEEAVAAAIARSAMKDAFSQTELGRMMLNTELERAQQ